MLSVLVSCVGRVSQHGQEAQQETGDRKTAMKQQGVTLIHLALEVRNGDEGQRLPWEKKDGVHFFILIFIKECIKCC